ncbi:hypothetical protein GF402_11595 [Candidatus Fermentibacteria bacterium]|nr:hypothetical protein [Candidatus Fermentibacteria bacterium]
MAEQPLKDLYRQLSDRLELALLDYSEDTPRGLTAVMRMALEGSGLREFALLAPASARWCGRSPEEGLPVAVAVRFLTAFLYAHSCLPDVDRWPYGDPLPQDVDQASLILSGDAFPPMAVRHLYRTGGRHTVLLIEALVDSMGASGILAGLSLHLDCRDGGGTELPEGREPGELHGGRLAQFASKGGAVIAGGNTAEIDDCALAGLKIGLGMDVLVGMATDEMLGPERRKELSLEATNHLDEAETIVGSGERSEIFRTLIEGFRRRFPSSPGELF